MTNYPPVNFGKVSFINPIVKEPRVLPNDQPNNWIGIRGKPYITVSAKGLKNGLSDIENDGADFGPDSYINGDPNQGLTQTSGIQEAWNYSENIFLLDGVYDIGTTITIPATSIATEYSMIGEHAPIRTLQDSTTYNNGVILKASSSGYPIIKHDTANGSTTFGNRVRIENVGLRQKDTTVALSHGIDISYAQEHIFKNMLIDVDTNIYTMPVSTVNSNGILLEIDDLGGTKRYCENVRIIGYDTGIYQIGDLCIFQEVVVEFCNFGFDMYSNGNGVYHPVIFNGVYLNQVIHGLVLNSDVKAGAAIYGKFDFQGSSTASDLQNPNFPWYTIGSVPTMGCRDASNGGNQGATGHITYSVIGINGGGIIQGYFWGGTPNSFKQSSLVNTLQYPKSNNTPTLTINPPVSGTAYQNTNPYDILIYLPVYTSTSGTAGNIIASIGPTSTPATQVVNDIVNPGTTSSNPRTIILKVPAGWYYEFTGTTTTFGTAIAVAD